VWVAAVLEVRSPGTSPGGWEALPTVGGLDSDLFRAGEQVRVNGNEGSAEVDGLTVVPVVTSFLQNPKGEILLLRRSDKVGTFRGRWAGVSGFLEEPTPEGQARKEILEETGLKDS
jgi:hypothetical protein